MKQVPDGQGKTGFRFDSLILDESGALLVDYLLSVKYTNQLFDMREIIWWRDRYNTEWTDNRILSALNERDTRTGIPGPPEQSREYKCYNEYLPVSILLRTIFILLSFMQVGERWPKPDLRSRIDSFTVFTVSVTMPQQIRSALDLMDEALKRAPAQELPVAYQDAGNLRPLKRYIGVDAEFSAVQLSDELLEQEINGKDSRCVRQIENGVYEGLCTVLTIAADRHLAFSFYILHMLQNAEASTVQEVRSVDSSCLCVLSLNCLPTLAVHTVSQCRLQ